MTETIQKLFDKWEICILNLADQVTFNKLIEEGEKILPGTADVLVFSYDWWAELGMGDYVSEDGVPKFNLGGMTRVSRLQTYDFPHVPKMGLGFGSPATGKTVENILMRFDEMNTEFRKQSPLIVDDKMFPNLKSEQMEKWFNSFKNGDDEESS